jgi:hypothetical protein
MSFVLNEYVFDENKLDILCFVPENSSHSGGDVTDAVLFWFLSIPKFAEI